MLSTTAVRATLRTHVESFVGERHPLSSPDRLLQAEHYLTEEFRRLGLPTSFHQFDALGGTFRNVIATLRPSQPVAQGTTTGRSGAADSAPLIIAAHYDTVQGSPGADDNASSLAVMLAAAQSLQAMPLSRPVRFIGFCLEEEDLMGSLAYASYLRDTEQEVYGVIVLECVGYARTEEGSQRTPPGTPIHVPSVGDFLAIVGNIVSADLTAAVERQANQQVPRLKTVSLVVPGNGEGLPDVRRSDHAAFWHYGYPAVMLTDTANFRNPHYHRPTDTIDTLDFTFMEHVALGVIAAASHLAGMDKG